MLKMLKIGCFKQNHCISGMPQGIPKQFLTGITNICCYGVSTHKHNDRCIIPPKVVSFSQYGYRSHYCDSIICYDSIIISIPLYYQFFEILPCINKDIDPVHMLWLYTLGLTITPSAIIRALKPVYKYG